MQQKFRRSKALLEAQLKDNPNNAFAHFNYAQLLRGAPIEVQQERSKEIIYSASRAVELTGPTSDQQRHIHLMALNQLAWAYFAIGNHSKSREYLDRALNQKPDYLDPIMLRGHLYSKDEQFENAISAYREFLKVQKDYRPELETDDIIVANVSNRAAANYGIALAYHALGNSIEARRHYRETLRENDEYHEANQFLGLLELEAGNDREAIQYLEAQLRTEQPTVHAAVALANVERDRGAASRALQYANQAVELDSRNETAVQLLVELLIETGRPLELPALYEKAQASGIALKTLTLAEARGWYSLGEYQRAVELFGKTQLNRQQSTDLVKQGNAQFKLSQFEAAADSYQSALTAGHQDDTIHRNYAITLLKTGKLHQAGTTLRAYLQQPGSDEGMWEILGDIYNTLGEYNLAVEAFESVLKVQKTSRNALFGLCKAYEALGHLNAAKLGMQQLARLFPADKIVAAKYTELSERCSESEQVH
jgi:tetratricopeptide (TPR) repeat protein